MIDTAKLHAHHQQDRGLQQARHLAVERFARQGHPPAAGTFYHHQIQVALQIATAMVSQLPGRHLAPLLLKANMRCHRRLNRHRIDLLIGHGQARLLLQGQGIGVAQALACWQTTRGHRFDGGRAQPLLTRLRQQATGHLGFAHVGIGAGHKKTRRHDNVCSAQRRRRW